MVEWHPFIGKPTWVFLSWLWIVYVAKQFKIKLDPVKSIGLTGPQTLNKSPFYCRGNSVAEVHSRSLPFWTAHFTQHPQQLLSVSPLACFTGDLRWDVNIHISQSSLCLWWCVFPNWSACVVSWNALHFWIFMINSNRQVPKCPT